MSLQIRLGSLAGSVVLRLRNLSDLVLMRLSQLIVTAAFYIGWICGAIVFILNEPLSFMSHH
jgi:hypothetical protein